MAKDPTRVTEARFTADVTKVMRNRGAMVYPLIAGHDGAPIGWPDRLVVSRQWIGLLEFKGLTTVISPNQETVIRELWRRRPGSVYIVRNAVHAISGYSSKDPTCVITKVDEASKGLRQQMEIGRSAASQLCWELQRLTTQLTQDTTRDADFMTMDEFTELLGES